MSGSHRAAYLGIDVTTTECALAVSDEQGVEDYASTPMRGKTACWSDPRFPAFQLDDLSQMLCDLLSALEGRDKIGCRLQGTSRKN